MHVAVIRSERQYGDLSPGDSFTSLLQSLRTEREDIIRIADSDHHLKVFDQFWGELCTSPNYTNATSNASTLAISASL